MNDHDLSPDERNLIDMARSLDRAPDDVRQRVRGAVLARVALAAAGTTVASTAVSEATAAVGATMLSKALVVLGLAGSSFVLLSDASSPPALDENVAPRHGAVAALVDVAEPPTEATPVAPRIEAAPARDEPPSASAALPPSPPTAALRSPLPVAEAPVAAAPAPAPPAPEAPAPAQARSRLTEELSLLRQVQQEMQAGNPEASLALLEQHERAHADGALREERSAARVIALCQAGRREEARAAALAFIAQSPTSPHASRVRHVCSEK